MRAGLNALNNRGQWPDGWQTASLKALNNRGEWHVVEDAAEHFRGFRGLRAGKTLNNRGQWPECWVEAAAEGFREF